MKLNKLKQIIIAVKNVLAELVTEGEITVEMAEKLLVVIIQEVMKKETLERS